MGSYKIETLNFNKNLNKVTDFYEQKYILFAYDNPKYL